MLRYVVVVLALTVSCSRDDSTSAVPLEGTIPAPVLPTASALRDVQRQEPAWLKALPKQPPPAERGEQVWASSPVLPVGAMARVGVFEVDAIHGDTYLLTDRLGQKVEGIPASLVHPIEHSKGLKDGDVVLFHTQTTPALIGRVAKLVPGAEIQVHYDFGGATRKTAVDHAEPPRTGITPMAYVTFPKSGGRSRGLVLAQSEDQSWIRTGSGHVEIHPTHSVEALPIATSPLKKGQRVRAFRWATGYQPGTVTETLEPGLRYQVRLDGDRPVGEYFFSALRVAK